MLLHQWIHSRKVWPPSSPTERKRRFQASRRLDYPTVLNQHHVANQCLGTNVVIERYHCVGKTIFERLIATKKVNVPGNHCRTPT